MDDAGVGKLLVVRPERRVFGRKPVDHWGTHGPEANLLRFPERRETLARRTASCGWERLGRSSELEALARPATRGERLRRTRTEDELVWALRSRRSKLEDLSRHSTRRSCGGPAGPPRRGALAHTGLRGAMLEDARATSPPAPSTSTTTPTAADASATPTGAARRTTLAWTAISVATDRPRHARPRIPGGRQLETEKRARLLWGRHGLGRRGTFRHLRERTHGGTVGCRSGLQGEG